MVESVAQNKPNASLSSGSWPLVEETQQKLKIQSKSHNIMSQIIDTSNLSP